MIFLIVLIILNLYIPTTIGRLSIANDAHRICVPETVKNACSQMVSEGSKQNVKLSCIIGRDRLDCLEKIHQHNADFSFAEPEDMYIASNIGNKDFVIVKEIRDKDAVEAEFRYKGVAVIRNDLNINSISELKGAKSCHTGVGRSVGYKIPLTKLTKMKVLGPLADTSISPRENELKALSSFFSKACLVGKWAPDNSTNQRLKKQYANLCALCEHPDICDYPDAYSGYDGALKCLTKSGGDIAWTKTVFVEKYFGLKGERLNNAEDYSYLCPDGERVPLGQTPCTWAARPWAGFIADSKLNNNSDLPVLRGEISKLNKLGSALSSEWFTLVLNLNDKTVTVDNANNLHPLEYLSKAKFYDVIERNVVAPRRCIRWCVTSDAAHYKCKNLKVTAFSRDIRPEFDCVFESSVDKCLETIRNGGADIITIDAADAINAINQFNCRAIAAEKYYNDFSQLYALAVVKSNSHFHNLAELKGKKSCHSYDMKSVGWVAPLFTLLNNDLINKEKCEYTDSFADFFSNDSCIPNTSYSEKSLKKCGENSEALGPLKCLISDHGDVAFVNHVNLLKSIDNNKTIENEIKLLCNDGTTSSFRDYEQCNWGKVPPKFVVTNIEKTDVELDEVKNALLAISNLYGSKPELFKLFGRYKKTNNVLFSNTAVGIKLIDDISEIIDDKFRRMISVVNYCQQKKIMDESESNRLTEN